MGEEGEHCRPWEEALRRKQNCLAEQQWMRDSGKDRRETEGARKGGEAVVGGKRIVTNNSGQRAAARWVGRGHVKLGHSCTWGRNPQGWSDTSGPLKTSCVKDRFFSFFLNVY